jgi:MraZ protein
MFLGEYQYALDSKARLTIPARFRELLAPTVVLTRHPAERCLMLLPMAEWQRLADRVSALSITDGNAALLRRMVFSAAEDLRPDAQGRILLSQRLREFARIENEVLIAGMNTFLELWNPDDWQAKYGTLFADLESNAQRFAALGI